MAAMNRYASTKNGRQFAVAGERQRHRAGQLVEADDRDQRSVLERADEAVHDRRHDEPQRLRQHDLALRLPIGEARATRRPRCCPFGIACRPPRTTSARYAAANSVMPTSTRSSTLIGDPCGMNSGNMNDAMNSTEISGTPRISST